MPLVNVTVVSSSKGHVPWTIVQIEPGLTFVQLFQKIVAGAHPMLVVDEGLSRAILSNVFVGQSKESLSVVDKSLLIDEVCNTFGHHIKYVAEHGVEPAGPEASTLQNAFTVLMESQCSLDAQKLPPKIQERTHCIS